MPIHEDEKYSRESQQTNSRQEQSAVLSVEDAKRSPYFHPSFYALTQFLHYLPGSTLHVHELLHVQMWEQQASVLLPASFGALSPCYWHFLEHFP